MELSKHSAVIASIHRQFVKTGRLSKEQGKVLNWLFELRGVGDYGGTAHVSREETDRAIEAADKFVRAAKTLAEMRLRDFGASPLSQRERGRG